MSTVDDALCWQCAGLRQIGILSRPSAGEPETAVLIIVGGPQVRAGSHRQFVELARGLAAEGLGVLRFDARGMGDSEGQPLGFEQLSDDIQAAIDQLQRSLPRLRRVVLWGLCDAASAALLYLHERRDPRVAGMILLNPWVRSPQSEAQARVRHYYRERLLQREFWLKLLRGGVGWGALRQWLRARQRGKASSAPASAHFAVRMAQAWSAFRGPILLILSGRDLTAQEFRMVRESDPAWHRVRQDATRVEEHALATASHTFSEPGMKAQVQALCTDWLRRLPSMNSTP